MRYGTFFCHPDHTLVKETKENFDEPLVNNGTCEVKDLEHLRLTNGLFDIR